MATVKMNIERMRSVASGLSSIATTVDEKYRSLSSAGSTLKLSTQALKDVPGYVQDLRDESTYIDGKVDWIVLVSSGDSGNVPDSGDVSYDVPGDEPDTIEEVETEIGKAMGSFGGHIASSPLEIEEGELSALESYLEKWGGRGRVATAMYEELGHEGTLALTEAVGNYRGILSSGEDGEESKSVRYTLGLIKRSLHVASNTWPSDKAHDFGAGLVEEARNLDYNSPEYDAVIPGARTEALTWLLYDAENASGSFLLGAAEKMDEIQRRDNERGEATGWGWQSLPAAPGFLPAVIDEADEGWARDTPSVVLHSLSGRPEAAYTFFNDDERRIEYWAGEHDYGSLGDLSGAAAALDVVSTDPSLRREHPTETASIAGLTIDAFANRDGFGPADRTDEGVEAARSLEHILETYMPSVVNSYSASQTGGNRPQQDVNGDGVPDLVYTVTTPTGDQVPNSPWFNSASLDKVLGVVGRDGQALLDFRSAVNQAQDDSLPEGATREGLELVSNSWAMVEGSITNAIGTGGIENAEADDAYAMAWIQLAGMPASEISGLASTYAPPGLGKAAGWASGVMVDWLKQQAVDTWASNAKKEEDYQNAAADQAYSDFTLRMLFAADRAGLNGYQDPDSGAELDETLGEAVKRNPDGSLRLITAEEFGNLDPEKKSAVRAKLMGLAGTADGMGTTVGSVPANFDTQFLERYR